MTQDPDVHTSGCRTEPEVDNVCTASVDSIMDLDEYAFTRQCKGIFLYSAATTQSTIDFSKEGVDDGVVQSPPSQCMVETMDDSPSPRLSIGGPMSPFRSYGGNIGTSRRLYEKVMPEFDGARNGVRIRSCTTCNVSFVLESIMF